MKNLTIAIDFDDTCCRDNYPFAGTEIPHAVDSLRELYNMGNRLILWTCREHVDIDGTDPLQEALDWFEKNDIPLYAVNEDPDSRKRGYIPSRKIHTDLVIDDKGFGIPKLYDRTGKPYVDWLRVMRDFEDQII